MRPLYRVAKRFWAKKTRQDVDDNRHIYQGTHEQ